MVVDLAELPKMCTVKQQLISLTNKKVCVMTIWWSYYSCFHFGPKYYRPAASNGHCHNRLLRLKLSALTANVWPKRQPDHSCMQLGPINGKHTD